MTRSQIRLLADLRKASQGSQDLDDRIAAELGGECRRYTRKPGGAIALLPRSESFDIDRDESGRLLSVSVGPVIARGTTKRGKPRTAELATCLAALTLRWKGKTVWGRAVP